MAQTDISPENWLSDYGDILYRYALIRVRSEATAEDLVQETLLAGLQGIAQFSGKASVRTWLVGILKHKIIDHYRKHSREVISISDDETAEDILAYHFDQKGHWKVDLVEWGTPEKSMNNEQFWQVFNRCLAHLPQRMADLLLLRTVDGLATEECCALLGFETDNQLWVTLSRTRVKLRQCLEANWFSEE